MTIPKQAGDKRLVSDALATDAPVPSSLASLAQAEQECRRCPLYRDATQAVPGEGLRKTRLMVVGEQPGNDEDLKGTPFVGPAGRVLDRALLEAGLDRGSIFVTNAVKHFKFEPRGKRRLHKRPNAYEIERCKWWIEQELRLVQPALVVALGATAVRGLLGRSDSIASLRGKIHAGENRSVLVTIHPSALLRVPDPGDREREFARFVRDLAVAGPYLAGTKSGT